MPYTESQHKLFEAAAHNAAIAKAHGMSQSQAAKMASEGIKDKPNKLAKELIRK